MHPPCPFAQSLPAEYQALCRAYAAVQERCSQAMAQQRADIALLQAQVLRLRAQAIVQTTALAFARQDHAALQGSMAGLPRRKALARHAEALAQRVQGLLAERVRRQWQAGAAPVQAAPPLAGAPAAPLPGKLALLQASLAAADLVVCQTGCLSHGAYWRDHEHCRRTGKACTQPGAPATTHLMVKMAQNPLQASDISYQNASA